jgi:hypothetical protein
MKKIKIFLLLVFLAINASAQETLVNGDFTIRDFFVEKDSIFYIEKRDVKYRNIKDINKVFDSYFIGGYGLRIFNNLNEIITVSNEFEQTVSSLRFYNKKSKIVEEIFYYKKGKAIASIQIPEYKFMVISMNDKNIIVVDYSKRPIFKEVHKIQLKSLARTVYYHNKSLFYATDFGDIFKYNFDSKESVLVYSCKEKITALNFYMDDIIFTTTQGNILIYNQEQGITKSLNIKNNFVLNTIIYDNKLICGTFKGSIIVVNLKNRLIEKLLDYHNKSVLSIVKGKRNEFYSSSIDRTLKKWKLN